MIYSKLPDINFPWNYQELMNIPIFMKEEVYKAMDEFIEEEKKNNQILRNRMQ